jgi:Spy/CpxP family protein refolding chaperone
MRAFTRISIALLSMFLAVAMVAQTAPAPSDNTAAPPHKMMSRHNGGFERMAQQLNLTDQQKTQIQDFTQAGRQQAQSIKQDTTLTPEQKRDKFRELRASTHQQVLGVLTPKQQEQMKQLRSQHAGMGYGKGAGMGHRMGPMAKLNLTDEQRAKIQPILQSSRQQAHAVRNDNTLTPEQKKAKMREIHQGAMTQMNSLLTPEQQQQWEQMRQHRGFGDKHGPPPPPPSGF